MKLFAFLLFFISLVVAVPVPSTAGIITSDQPVLGHPGLERPVEPRPLESRPIGTRSLEARQNTVAGAYIVEFKQGYTHDAFKEYLAAQKIEYTFRFVYSNPKIFYGVSIQLNNGGDFEKVRKWEGVQVISPVHIITIPKDPPYSTQPVPVDA